MSEDKNSPTNPMFPPVNFGPYSAFTGVNQYYSSDLSDADRAEARDWAKKGSPFAQQQMARYKGEDIIKDLYGASAQNIGADATDYSNRVKGMLDQNTAKSQQYLQNANRSMASANAKAGLRGVDTTAMNAQNRMNAKYGADVINEESRRNALDMYGKNIGAKQKGVNQIRMGHEALANSQAAPAVAAASNGALGTVICTELFNNGYMDKETFALDMAYGQEIRKEKPMVYVGYRFLADPVVSIMRKSPLFTKIISIPALCWADNMAGRRNIIGKIISVCGESVCGLVGGIVSVLSREVNE